MGYKSQCQDPRQSEDSPVHNVGLADHPDPLPLLRNVLGDKEHVSEEETVDVNLRGGSFLHFEVALHK